MKVTSEKAEHNQIVLDVEMEPAELDKYLNIAYRHVVQRTAVPGFRRGKAPRDVLERFVGKGTLLEDAIEYLIPEACNKAIEEQKIEPIAHPHVELTSVEPVRFKATVPLKPTVKLCDYKDIRVEPQSVSVTDEQVSAVIEQLREQQAIFTPVDRPVRYSDIITMAIQSCVGERELLNEKETPYRVMKDFDLPLPGFSEKLEGAAKGEQREFSLVFPESHPAAEFRGKECGFKVTVKDIKEKELPALDDAFAKSLGAGIETLDALKEKAKADLTARVEGEERARYEDAALQRLVECAQIDYPPVLLDSEVDRMFRQQEERAERGGRKLKDLLRSTNKTEEQLKEEMRPIAEKRLVRSLALGQLAEEEKVEVTAEEIAAETTRMSKDAGKKAEEMKQFLELPSVQPSVSNSILTRKTVERLLEIAKSQTPVAAPALTEAARAEEASSEEEKSSVESQPVKKDRDR